jgi:hypothetical protein
MGQCSFDRASDDRGYPERIDYRTFGKTVSKTTCLKSPFRGVNQVKQKPDISTLPETGHFYFALTLGTRAKSK